MPKRGVGFSKAEISFLLDNVERILPIQPDEWEQVWSIHNSRFPESSRTAETVRKKFQRMYLEKTNTNGTRGGSSSVVPPHIVRAKKIQLEIKKKSSSAEGGSVSVSAHAEGDDDEVGQVEVQVDVGESSSEEEKEEEVGGNATDTESYGSSCKAPQVASKNGLQQQGSLQDLLQFILVQNRVDASQRERDRKEYERIRERDRKEYERIRERDRREYENIRQREREEDRKRREEDMRAWNKRWEQEMNLRREELMVHKRMEQMMMMHILQSSSLSSSSSSPSAAVAGTRTYHNPPEHNVSTLLASNDKNGEKSATNGHDDCRASDHDHDHHYRSEANHTRYTNNDAGAQGPSGSMDDNVLTLAPPPIDD